MKHNRFLPNRDASGTIIGMTPYGEMASLQDLYEESRRAMNPAADQPAPDAPPTADQPAPAVAPVATGVVARLVATVDQLSPRFALFIGLVGALVVATVLASVLRGEAPSAPVVTGVSTTGSVPSAVASPLPSPTPIPRIARAVAVFAAPNGDALGAIDAGRAYTVTARFGTSWVQLDAAESGRVWVRAADLPEQALGGLADLAPPPTATPAPRAAPVYAPAPQAPAYVPQVPAGPTTDTRPVSCVKTLAGERCERGLDEHDQAVAAEIEATAAAYNAPFQAATNATATAFAMPTPRTKD